MFGESGRRTPGFSTDIRDEGAHYLLQADLPGFRKEDIDLHLQDGVLTITAKRQEEQEEKKEGKYLCRERRMGSCARAFDVSGIREEELRNSLPDIRISFRLNPETQRPVTLLNGEEVEERIRTMEVSSHVSPVAALGFVREALVKQQQEMGRQKGIVMDGRDIGTVVFPDAELKIFVTASADIRARRRYDELKAKGRPASYDEILKNVEERDYIDQNREVGPLRKAEDAILLDNSHMTIAEQKQWLAEQFQKATNG